MKILTTGFGDEIVLARQLYRACSGRLAPDTPVVCEYAKIDKQGTERNLSISFYQRQCNAR